MKKYFFLIFLVFILQSCLDFRPCHYKKTDIVARYYCYNNENAINWLDLNKDGTFSHYYKEGTIQLSHHGTWKRDKKSNCIIKLREWKTFNEDGKEYELLGGSDFFISYNYLDIGPDGESSTSFKKSNEDMSVNPLGNN